MKYLMAIMAVFTLASAPVLAQTAGAVAGSASQSGAAALSGSASQSGAALTQIYNNAGTSTTAMTGTRTLKTAPDSIAPSLGSGHPCMINTSVGFSVIGGAASGGSGKVDVGCMMMRSANAVDNTAGRYYYAAKDKTACQAWRRVGALPIDYPCTKKEQLSQKKAAETQPVKVSTRNAPAATTRVASAGFSKCAKRDDGAVVISYKYGADKTVAQAACLASLGY